MGGWVGGAEVISCHETACKEVACTFHTWMMRPVCTLPAALLLAAAGAGGTHMLPLIPCTNTATVSAMYSAKNGPRSSRCHPMRRFRRRMPTSSFA